MGAVAGCGAVPGVLYDARGALARSFATDAALRTAVAQDGGGDVCAGLRRGEGSSIVSGDEEQDGQRGTHGDRDDEAEPRRARGAQAERFADDCNGVDRAATIIFDDVRRCRRGRWRRLRRARWLGAARKVAAEVQAVTRESTSARRIVDACAAFARPHAGHRVPPATSDVRGKHGINLGVGSPEQGQVNAQRRVEAIDRECVTRRRRTQRRGHKTGQHNSLRLKVRLEMPAPSFAGHSARLRLIAIDVAGQRSDRRIDASGEIEAFGLGADH
mmetsp:Transcript_14669/g.43034  ORF Transcript_14669/g.43034 Transcript_14669/m.43034 type:complete len:273 (+) Transcript_14669:1609-2427(+)